MFLGSYRAVCFSPSAAGPCSVKACKGLPLVALAAKLHIGPRHRALPLPSRLRLWICALQVNNSGAR